MLVFWLSFLCKLPTNNLQPNIERRQLRKTLTKTLLLGWLRKVKNLNTEKIQTCFPEFLNISTNVSVLFFTSNKNANQFLLKSNYAYF